MNLDSGEGWNEKNYCRRCFYSRVFSSGRNEPCYILSSDYALNEKNVVLQDAVCQAAASPEAALILGSTFAVVFTEAMKGPRGKYLLCEHRPAN